MAQANPHYAVLGDGRLARHMRHYLGLLGLAASGWSRRASDFNTHHHATAEDRLRRTLEPASHVLLLVADRAIPRLLGQYAFLHEHRLVHCAGALSLPGVAGAHPLMTFAGRPYTLEQYRRIPFLVDEGRSFAALMPGLPNPAYRLSPTTKAFYHALCVMAGNFTQLMWQAIAERFEQRLSLPVEVLEPYLRNILDNFLAEPATALTGPLSRGDARTVERNIAALDHDALQDLYRAFVGFYENERRTARADTQRQERPS